MIKILYAYVTPDKIPQHVVTKEIKKVVHTAKSFGIKEKDITVLNLGKPFEFISSCNVISKYTPKGLHILLEPERALKSKKKIYSLPEFKHPKNCTYVIWSDYGTTPFLEFEKAEIVTIPMATEAPLWAIVSLGVVLYDRWIKNDCSI